MTFPRLKALMVFGSYKNHPDPAAWAKEIRQTTNATDVIFGINVVSGDPWCLIGDIDDIGDRCAALRAAGIRPHVSYWDKPHDEDTMYQDLDDIAAAPESRRPVSIMPDIEGDVLGDDTLDHAARASRLASEAAGWPCELSVTVIWFDRRRAAPYIDAAAWVLVQILSHIDPKKGGCGPDDADFYPGFLTQRAAASWRQVARSGKRLVWLVAAYKQTYKGMTPRQTIEIQARAPMGYGFEEVGVFSWPWFKDSPEVQSMLYDLAPERDQPTWESDDMHKLIDKLKTALEQKGHKWFDGGKPYNVNMLGIRNPRRAYDEHGPRFDDELVLAYRDDNCDWQLRRWEATTDPGHYLKRPIASVRKKGTAILKAGQYRGAYKIGAHFDYQAVVQAGGPVTVYRDNSRDFTLDLDTPQETGRFGINIHKRKGTDDFVRGASAGCQVFRFAKDFEAFMAIMREARSRFSNSFTYTLIDQADIDDWPDFDDWPR